MRQMEHRFGTRHPLDAAVTLRARGVGAVTGRIREASISGMYVEAPAALFAPHSVIDVELTLPGVANLRTYRWQAMVVRRTGQGLGLLFDRLRPPAITRLLARAQTAPAMAVLPGNVTPLRPATSREPVQA